MEYKVAHANAHPNVKIFATPGRSTYNWSLGANDTATVTASGNSVMLTSLGLGSHTLSLNGTTAQCTFNVEAYNSTDSTKVAQLAATNSSPILTYITNLILYDYDGSGTITGGNTKGGTSDVHKIFCSAYSTNALCP